MSDEELTSRIARIEQQISFLLDREIEDDEQDELGDQPIEPPVVVGDVSAYDSLFEIFDVDATAKTFSIREDASTTGMGTSFYYSGVCVAGHWIGVYAGAGLDGPGGGWHDYRADPAISATSWVYIKVTRATIGNSAADMIVGTSLPDGDDDEEIFPLWYIPISGGEIDIDNIMDYRFTKHWVAGA